MKKALAIALAALALALALAPGAALADEGGVAASGTCGGDNSCTWTLYGDGELVVEPVDGKSGQLGDWGTDYPPWYDKSESIKSVRFKGAVRATTCRYMFANCNCLGSIEGLDKLDTGSVTDMAYMFNWCESLKSLDLSGFRTANVKSMSFMFASCTSLASLDLSGFKTPNVTDMTYMFLYCTSLESLDLSGLDTSQVTGMSSMFNGCSSLASLDLSGFDTSQVTDMSGMFQNCTSLASLDLSSFDTRKVKNMMAMFNSSSNLEAITVGGLWSTEAVQKGNSMFSGCSKLAGDRGTKYDSAHDDVGYARIDNGQDAPGYLSRKGIEGAKLSLSKASFTYNGKAQKPTVKVVVGHELRAGTDYDAAYSNAGAKDAGTYTVTATGKGAYTGTATARYTIAKAAQPMTANPKAKTVKAKKLAKKAVKVKGTITVKGQKGAVSYKKVKAVADKKAQKAAKKAKATKKLNKALKKFKVNAKNGTITVPKGLVKGTYSLQVQVSAKGDANHKAGTKTVTVKIKVK